MTSVRGKRIVLLAGMALAAGAGMAAHAPAAAQTCAGPPVTARGEPSRFEWLARTKARANWRRKVRALPGLGAAYADWSAAGDAEERCIRAERTVYCIFTGIPCRR